MWSGWPKLGLPNRSNLPIPAVAETAKGHPQIRPPFLTAVCLRFRLVTDRAAATGTPVAGSFEGEQSKQQCFQLCILEARCKGVFLTTAGECSLVNEIATMETTSVSGLSFLKRSSLPDKYAPDVKGPLGSETLRERNEAEGQRDQRIMRASALVAHKESRNAQIAWRESDARINERQQSDEARDQLRLAIATGHSNEYAAISKSDLQMRQVIRLGLCTTHPCVCISPTLMIVRNPMAVHPATMFHPPCKLRINSFGCLGRSTQCTPLLCILLPFQAKCSCCCSRDSIAPALLLLYTAL